LGFSIGISASGFFIGSVGVIFFSSLGSGFCGIALIIFFSSFCKASGMGLESLFSG